MSDRPEWSFVIRRKSDGTVVMRLSKMCWYGLGFPATRPIGDTDHE